MNGGMVVFGLLMCILGGYLIRNSETEIERGLRWRGFDTQKMNLRDQTKAITRARYSGLAILSLGIVTIAWGVLSWPGDQLAGVLVLGAVGAAIVNVITTM